MSEVAKRDFSNFYLGDDVLLLADGVARSLAEFVDVEVPKPPLGENNKPITGESYLAWRNQTGTEINDALYTSAGVHGKDKVLRNNEEVWLHPAAMGGMVQAAGTQKALSRSLWTPEIEIVGGEDMEIMYGAVGPWTIRSLNLLLNAAKTGTTAKLASLQFGNRIMNAPADLRCKEVQQFMAKHKGESPKEYEFAEEIMSPQLEDVGYVVELDRHETGKGEEIAKVCTEAHPEYFLPGKKVIFTRVANSVIQMACEFREPAQRLYPEFDIDSANPQVLLRCDELQAAMNRGQLALPNEFQSSYTGSRQVQVTAHKLDRAEPVSRVD